MPAEQRHDRIAVLSSHRPAHRSDLPDQMPRLCRSNSRFHDLARHSNEFLCLRRRLAADDVHSRRVRKKSVEIGRDVHVDYIARLQNFFFRRNPVTHYIVDRRANALWEAFKAQTRRVSAMLDDVIVDGGIEALRVEPRLYNFFDQIERTVVYHRRLFDLLNLLRVVNQFVRRTYLIFVDVQFHFFQPRVKIQMAFLILLAAPAPTRIISFHVSQPLLNFFDDVHLPALCTPSSI